MTSRNARYERKKTEQGLKKVTVWVPADVEAEFKLLADVCSENRRYVPNTVRDLKTGRYVSLERAVTDDDE
ncbi:hypothetical protein [Photobacterium halotolerans]|uniref:Uncharacterized protein n=1 Tax=Photobacterium halotolerans TaxID=265726 RepID=A0A7X4WAZ5_9GAMM|nr:hypothetical protein [Photobacterium halotolerans]NAW64530.1 hypothetical protein [Photobacterium halotolerans]